MKGKRGPSFRILHPDPFDLVRRPFRDALLQCAVEFPSPSAASRFEKFLLGRPPAAHVRTQKDGPAVLWSIPLGQGPSLAKALRPFPELARQVKAGVRGYASKGTWSIQGRGRRFAWDRRTQVMGILNVTPDSFSDGGRFHGPGAAVEQALRLEAEGADWIDVGGESTRPGAGAVPASEEKRRVLPVLKACAKALRIPLSIDTYKAEVARAAVGEGAQLVNDIGALGLDPRMGKTLARLGVPVILMHMRGRPRTMQRDPRYSDVVGEILAFFRERLAFARDCGIPEERLLIDPGFGFGKSPWHNIELTRRLWEFRVLGRPIVLGPSRKSTLGRLLGGLPPEERSEATDAALAAAVLKGADWVRVHDVKAASRVVKIADALRYDRGLAPP